MQIIRRAGRAVFRVFFKEQVQALDEQRRTLAEQLQGLVGIQQMLMDIQRGLDERSAELERKAESIGLKGSEIYSLDINLPMHTTLSVEDVCNWLAEAVPVNAEEFERYCLSEKLSFAVYPKYKFGRFGRLILEDDMFIEYYKQKMDYGNWHSLDSKYLLNEMLDQVEHLPGDYVECGVYKGATAYLLCKSAQDRNKHVHLFDSFEGLSEPGPSDGTHWVAGKFAVSSQEAVDYLGDFDCFTIYDGWIPQRFPDVDQISVSFLHLDVDLFQPTLHSLEFLYERMVPGGVIVCDDYGVTTCPGAKKAMDQFFKDKSENVAALPTGQGLTIKQ